MKILMWGMCTRDMDGYGTQQIQIQVLQERDRSVGGGSTPPRPPSPTLRTTSGFYEKCLRCNSEKLCNTIFCGNTCATKFLIAMEEAAFHKGVLKYPEMLAARKEWLLYLNGTTHTRPSIPIGFSKTREPMGFT